MGDLSWPEATAGEAIRIEGPRDLAASFPSWNRRSGFAHIEPAVARRASTGSA